MLTLSNRHRYRHPGIAGDRPGARAAAYLAHPVLGPRFCNCTALVNATPGHDAHAIFLDPAPSVFATALDRFFAGVPDAQTLALLD